MCSNDATQPRSGVPAITRRALPVQDRAALQPEEPPVPDWYASDERAFADHVLAVLNRVIQPAGRPGIIAVDGRSGSGKTTVTSRLTSVVPDAQVLHIDDVDWNEPLYQWDHLLVTALGELHRAGSLDFTPPAWHRHGRKGSIVVPAGAPFVIVEGTGAGMRAVVDLIDVHIWVQTDDGVAEERGIGRDTALGVNGDAEETIHFWHWWMAGERSFFAADRPWERAHLIVSGEPLPGLAAGELAWAEVKAPG